jgi:hypothetical protein
MGTFIQTLDRISLKYGPNANERTTQTKWTKNERTLHTNDTNNARYTKRTHDTRTNERNETNELYGKRKRTNERYTKRTNHWSVPMTNDPGSIEVQYQCSIVLLFEWLLCKLMWLTNLIFYTQLIYINDKWVGKVIG